MRTKLLLALLFLVGVFALYIVVMLNWSYSVGERAGILQKFSRKGWICKTYEGELAMSIVPGVTPTIWYFTVRDHEVARRVNETLGRRVVLHYREHLGLPRCFGDTPNFLDSVRVVE